MTSYLKKLFCMPQRWIISTMGFFAFFNAYTHRICLSIAITKMAKPLNHTKESHVDACPSYYDNITMNSTTSVVNEGVFDWSEYTQGIILSSFYWGYLITHLPGGLLAEKFGSKLILGLGVLFSSFLTILTPTITTWGGAYALITVRFLMGLCGGVVHPGISCLLSQWIPAHERSLTGAFVYTGIRLGILISSVISGIILNQSSDDWPLIFHLFGFIGVIWYIFWLLLCYNNPKDHPFITQAEKNYLRDQLESHTHEKRPPFPWKYALKSRSFIALVVMQSGSDWCSYTIMSDLPKYMANVLKLPVHLNGYASSMYQLSSWLFCIFMSSLSDWLIVRKYMTTTNIRKMNTTVSSLGSGIMLVLAMYVGCNITGAITLITIGLTLAGSYVPGIKVNVLDLSPNYAGTLMGISNGIGAFMGVLAPYTVGVLAPNQTLSEWRLIFWIVAVVYTVTTLNFILSASGEVQEWNDPDFLLNKKKKEEYPKEEVNLLSVNKTSIEN